MFTAGSCGQSAACDNSEGRYLHTNYSIRPSEIFNNRTGIIGFQYIPTYSLRKKDPVRGVKSKVREINETNKSIYNFNSWVMHPVARASIKHFLKTSVRNSSLMFNIIYKFYTINFNTFLYIRHLPYT
jgi:hypothetical protein